MTETTAVRPPASTPSSLPTTGRLLAVDATRGLALVGMMAVHSLTASTPDGAATLSFSIFAGRAAAAYAVLAGVSIMLITGRRRLSPGPRASGKIAGLVARGLLIGAIGLVLGHFTDAEWAVVILPYYAVMFLLAAPLTLLRTRTLALLAPVLLIGTPVLSQLLRPHLGEPIWTQLTVTDLFTSPGSTASTLLITGEFPAVVWMTYVVVGMLIGRLNLRSVNVAGGLLAAGVTMMLTAPITSWFLLEVMGGRESLTGPAVSEILEFGADGTVPTDTWWWLAVDAPHTGAPLDLLATIGSTLAVLGGLLLLRRLTTGTLGKVVRAMMAPLVAAGALSLTAYVAHIAFINSDFDVYSPWGGYVRQLIAVGILGMLWRMTAGRGPLEGFVTACTRRVDRWTRTRLERTEPSDTAH